MKKLTFIALILTSFLFLSKRSVAQDYPIAAGVKFGGYENGFSVKYFTNSTTALEGILGIRNHGIVITGLYEVHQEAFKTAGLKFYYGFGAHVGSVGSGVYKTYGGDQYYNDNRILLGADGVLGLEYKIADAPIAISLDLNPRVELATGPFFDLAPGLGLKYTF